MNLFEKLENMDHEEVVFCRDRETGLRAIIAVHDTSLGPALGGCRMWNYQSEKEALFDVLRLSRARHHQHVPAPVRYPHARHLPPGPPRGGHCPSRPVDEPRASATGCPQEDRKSVV